MQNLIVAVLIAALTAGFYAPTHAQNPTSFTPNDQYSIPESNGTINFGFSGNYSSATLQDGAWTFRNLQLDHPQSFGGFDLNSAQSVGDLKFSAEDSNVTIWAYLSFYYTIPVYSLVYTAQGEGKQTVNLGLNSTDADVTEWSVIVGDNVFLAEGAGWSLLPDETIVVSGATGNVTIAHFELGSVEKTLIFSLEHSVAIVTAIVLAVVVVAAVAVKVKAKRKQRRIS